MTYLGAAPWDRGGGGVAGRDLGEGGGEGAGRCLPCAAGEAREGHGEAREGLGGSRRGGSAREGLGGASARVERGNAAVAGYIVNGLHKH